jgi:alpha-L-fucosidase 2
MPIKFNGSLFTVDAERKGRHFDADYRAWGGPYWFQNTRFPYWSMLPAGDFDLMQPLFRMYLGTLPLARERTRVFYGHEGAFWPETMYFWGAMTSKNYGWNRRGRPIDFVECGPIRYHWENGLELTAMMLEYFDLTQDKNFVRETLLPLADPIFTFYDKHYPRDSKGRLRFQPAQSLETYWGCVNPMPEVAGLKWDLKGLLTLPPDCTTADQRALWRRMEKELPPLPLRVTDGKKFLDFAEVTGSVHNCENPELYAIFPFRLYGVGKPDLELARRSFAARRFPQTGGWQQNAIQAALLGLTEEATRMVTSNFSTKNRQSRFPAFWGPNYDWVPDQDHGCVAMIALQSMLLQSDGMKIHLLPAWPKKWDVDFQLCCPGRATVQGVYRAGKLEKYEIHPAEHKLDVVLPP